MKCALAALAFASILSTTAWAQESTPTELADGGPAVRFATPAPCPNDAIDSACVMPGLLQPSYDIRREFDGYYFEAPGKR